ncbi:hypothetical protein [Azospirillum rugosum]|uniref:Uncharacterized protein n=1 Tax=Azospirillum rugosum TaxID=416170 RepID=A0ABS4STT3_9PROT|nr:hypothetical protein [Azospirillum rugosum]MBP2295964.1 hypothetical protein [Azospirillum rugosum]MDQ0529554.1 hypothetical protein [Azospirillum rugosum]
MNKALVAAIFGGIALILSAAASSQTTSSQTAAANLSLAQSFPALMEEARNKVPSSTDRGIVNTSLASAEWYWEAGQQAKALSYLNFARGRLGLKLVPVDAPTQQAERTK